EGEPDGGETADDTEHTPRHAAFDELLGPSEQTAVPRQATPDDDQEAIPRQDKGGGSGRMLAIAIVPLLLVVAGFAAVRAPQAAYAGPCPVTTAAVKPDWTTSRAAATNQTTPASPKAGVVSSPSPAPAAAQAEPVASPSEPPTGGLLANVV